ncbi:MAG: peptide chain release factor N(5)-glutamine methyltransferase, partial [Woeseia sp.]|nr:peptide chain release factor N(5)-glutamine methyltransferase [Woeseia sp.]
MTALPSIRTVLEGATTELSAISESARLDAELLLARAIDMPRSFLFAHPEDELDEAAIARFAATLARRLDGEPLAYICGQKEFWSMELFVAPATLVPRPDTEVLVEQALGQIPRRASWRVLDLGTGSGAIALAIARDRPLCDVVATDISAEALAVAALNARQLGLPNIDFRQGSWAEPVLGETFDVVVSNPPYVAEADAALDELKYEPRSALAAGSDGLDAIRVVAADSLPLTAPNGAL